MSIRRAVLILIVLILFVLFIQWIIGYLEYGQIDITTNGQLNSISLKQPNNTTFSIQKDGTLNARVKAGDYLISVQRNSNATSQYIQIKARQTKYVYISLTKIGGVEPVTYDNVNDVTANSSQLLYLDPTDSGINDINTQNQDTETGYNYGLQNISWANPSFGVGENASGNLYVIQNGSINPLSLPASGYSKSSLSFVVALNKNIYVGVGSSVYVGTSSGKFKNIYNSRQAGAVLAPGFNRVSVINTGYNDSPASIVTIDDSGKHFVHELNTFINAWSSWSPGNKYIVVAGSSTGEVLNSSLQQVATIPQANFTNPVWLNNNTLFYSINDQLWSYDVLSQKAEVIATMPTGDQIEALSISTDGAYIYIVTTADTPGNQILERIGLKGQQVSNVIYNLQDFLLAAPAPGAGYAINLINFSGKPTVILLLDDGTNHVQALQSAQQELSETVLI